MLYGLLSYDNIFRSVACRPTIVELYYCRISVAGNDQEVPLRFLFFIFYVRPFYAVLRQVYCMCMCMFRSVVAFVSFLL